MTAKSFVDTNVVLYTIGKDTHKADIARELVGAQPSISTQVVNESISVCLRKLSFTREKAYAFGCTLMDQPAHLTRIFRQHYGHTIGSHVRQLRLEAARSQLGDAQRSTLAEVAVACGFSDQSHLTRLFHAAYGITPARFRRESGG
jgi:AraC-like DNA-binding protein